MSFVRKLYQWVEHWARTPIGPLLLFLLAFAESSFFPVPPDVLLIGLVLVHPNAWVLFALICTLGSVIGGLFGYWIGFALWGQMQDFFFQYVFNEEAFSKVQSLYQQYDFWAVFAAAFTPIPYKVFTIAAGVFELSIPSFVLASIAGRGGRFFLVALILWIFGVKVKPFLGKYFNILSIAFFVLLVGGFVLIKFFLKH